MKLKKKKLDLKKEEELQNEPKEKGDFLAMLIAAFVTLFLPAVAVLCAFVGIIFLVLHLLG